MRGADEQQAPRPVARDPDARRHGGSLDAGQLGGGARESSAPSWRATVASRGVPVGVGEVVGHDLTVCRVAGARVDHPPCVAASRRVDRVTIGHHTAYARGMSAAGSGHPTLAVTGSTGWLGGLVARDLADRGVAQRLLVRDVARAPELPGSVAARCSYRDADAARAALEGVATLFMVSAAENADRLDEHRAFVDAAAAAGVAPRRLRVLLRRRSRRDVHARPRPRRHRGAPPRRRAWRGRSCATTSTSSSWTTWSGDDGVIRGPAGDGRAAVVSHDDIARVAVAVLLDPASHAGATYDLTGPEALTFAEMAATITRGHRPRGALPRRDARGGVCVPRGLRCAGLAGRRLGLDLHRRGGGRVRRRQRRRRAPDRPSADLPAGVPRGPSARRADTHPDPIERAIRPRGRGVRRARRADGLLFRLLVRGRQPTRSAVCRAMASSSFVGTTATTTLAPSGEMTRACWDGRRSAPGRP